MTDRTVLAVHPGDQGRPKRIFVPDTDGRHAFWVVPIFEPGRLMPNPAYREMSLRTVRLDWYPFAYGRDVSAIVYAETPEDAERAFEAWHLFRPTAAQIRAAGDDA